MRGAQGDKGTERDGKRVGERKGRRDLIVCAIERWRGGGAASHSRVALSDRVYYPSTFDVSAASKLACILTILHGRLTTVI